MNNENNDNLRCLICNKKIRLTDIKCKCGIFYCVYHKYPDQHNCKFDYKQEGRELLDKLNPKIIFNKISSK